MMQNFGIVNNKYKTMLCKHWETSKTCPMGARCHFAHGKEELRSLSDPLPAGQEQLAMTDPILGTMLNQSYSNYKTIKCKFFEQGLCKFGQGCSFAHGEPELKNVDLQYMINPQLILQAQQNYQKQQQVFNEQITHLQLQSIIYNIDQSKPTDPVIMTKLKTASELWQANNDTACAQLLNEIIYRKEAKDTEKTLYQKILTEAQQLAANWWIQIQEQQQQQITQQMQGLQEQLQELVTKEQEAKKDTTQLTPTQKLLQQQQSVGLMQQQQNLKQQLLLLQSQQQQMQAAAQLQKKQ